MNQSITNSGERVQLFYALHIWHCVLYAIETILSNLLGQIRFALLLLLQKSEKIELAPYAEYRACRTFVRVLPCDGSRVDDDGMASITTIEINAVQLGAHATEKGQS